jgi:hypothetical protein
MSDPRRELEHLRKLAAADPTKRFGKLYRLVSHRELLQDLDSLLLASRVQRGVARSVLRALGGDVLQ